MCRQDTFDLRLFQGDCAPSLTCISKSVGLPTDLLSTPGMKSVCFLPALPAHLFLGYIDLMMYVFPLTHSINLIRRPSLQIEPLVMFAQNKCNKNQVLSCF